MENQRDKLDCCVIIVTHNIDFLIEHQIKTIRNLCQDKAPIYVAENSNDKKIRENIINICKENNVLYKDFQIVQHGSFGHAMALNMAYSNLSKNIGIF